MIIDPLLKTHRSSHLCSLLSVGGLIKSEDVVQALVNVC